MDTCTKLHDIPFNTNSHHISLNESFHNMFNMNLFVYVECMYFAISSSKKGYTLLLISITKVEIEFPQLVDENLDK